MGLMFYGEQNPFTSKSIVGLNTRRCRIEINIKLVDKSCIMVIALSSSKAAEELNKT
jgi:hypothetical protein